MRKLFIWIVIITVLLILTFVLDQFTQIIDAGLLIIITVGIVGSGWYLFWRHE